MSEDLISREAVIDALNELSGVGGIYLFDPEKVFEAVGSVPSGVVRCVECRFWSQDADDSGLCVVDIPPVDMPDVDGVRRLGFDFCSYGEGKAAEVAPPTDKVEVIRCKDCKFPMKDRLLGQLWCNGERVNEDHFCAEGQRRDDHAAD